MEQISLELMKLKEAYNFSIGILNTTVSESQAIRWFRESLHPRMDHAVNRNVAQAIFNPLD